MELGGTEFSLWDYIDVGIKPGEKIDTILSDFGLTDKPKSTPVPGTTTIIQKTSPLLNKKVLITGAAIGGALLLFIAMRQK